MGGSCPFVRVSSASNHSRFARGCVQKSVFLLYVCVCELGVAKSGEEGVVGVVGNTGLHSFVCFLTLLGQSWCIGSTQAVKFRSMEGFPQNR